jgi:hypothetical protein
LWQLPLVVAVLLGLSVAVTVRVFGGIVVTGAPVKPKRQPWVDCFL